MIPLLVVICIWIIPLITSPFIFSLNLVLLALTLTLATWSLGLKWARLALRIIFIGGIIVVFLYVTSLSPNLKIHTKNKSTQLILLLLPISIVCEFIHFSSKPSEFYSMQNTCLLMGLVAYLLLTLFIVSKSTQTFKGSLTSKIFRENKAFNFS